MRFDGKELEAVAARAAEDPIDVGTLLVLRGVLDDEQRALLRASLRAHAPPDAQHWMEVSRLDERAGDLEAARAALRAASALVRLDPESSLRSAIGTKARKLGLTSADLRADPTLDRLLLAGCLALEAGADPMAISLESGGTVRFAAQGEDGTLVVLTVRFRSLEAHDPITMETWAYGGQLQRSVGIGEQTAVWFGSSPCELEGSALEEGRLQLRVRRTR